MGGPSQLVFLLSKFSLPWFRHECVPETRFLSDVNRYPDNLDDYVLKPLYSFAGLGVNIRSHETGH
jgi:glutathionylspermidine synthase